MEPKKFIIREMTITEFLVDKGIKEQKNIDFWIRKFNSILEDED